MHRMIVSILSIQSSNFADRLTNIFLFEQDKMIIPEPHRTGAFSAPVCPVNYSNPQKTGIILNFTALLFGAYALFDELYHSKTFDKLDAVLC